MGASTPYIVFRGVSGQTYTLNFYCAGGDAIGYIPPCQFNGTATATSPTDFVLPEPCVIEYITGPATGVLTVDVNGMPTPTAMNLATVIAMVARPNTSWAKLAGGPTRRYNLRVVTALAA